MISFPEYSSTACINFKMMNFVVTAQQFDFVDNLTVFLFQLNLEHFAGVLFCSSRQDVGERQDALCPAQLTHTLHIIIGHGREADGHTYCCAHCARAAIDRNPDKQAAKEPHDQVNVVAASGSEWAVDEAGRESFPASDPPSFSPGHT